MIKIIGRLSGTFVFILTLVISSNAPAIAQQGAKDVKEYDSPIFVKEDGVEIQTHVKSCFTVSTKTISNITELILEGGTDPVVAQEKIKLPVDHALLICGNARYVLENGKIKRPSLLDWVKQQELGWRTTKNTASQAAFEIARLNHAVDEWNNNWTPKMKKKKKKLRDIGKNISHDYNELLSMSQKGQFDDAFEAKLSKFRTTVNASKSLQMTLVDLRKFVIKDLKTGSPYDGANEPNINIINMMLPITAIDKTDHWWGDNTALWNSKLLSSWEEMVHAYEKLEKQVKSLREQTLFRNHGKPLQGIKFTEIHPTFQRLYDDLYKKGENHEREVAAEERRWSKDKKAIDQYFEECGASAEREQKLQSTGTGTTATAVHDLELEYADGPSSASNVKARRLKYARMTGSDEEKRFYEKGKTAGKSEAEIEKEWDEFIAKTIEQEKAENEAALEHDRKVYEDGMVILEKQDEQAQKEYREWENKCDKKESNAFKVWNDNVKRRKALGMPEKPLQGDGNPDFIKSY